jgi:hypothetical protein
MIFPCNHDIIFVKFLMCFLYILLLLLNMLLEHRIFTSKKHIKITSYYKYYHSMFHVYNFLLPFLYKFLVLKVQTLLSMQNI